MSEQLYGQGVEFGDEIGPLVKTPTAEQVQHFLAVWTRSDASSGMVGRFTDEKTAKSEGLAGPIVPGNMTQAFVAQLVTDWAGPAGRLRSLDVNFRRPARHGDSLKCVGLVTDKREEGVLTVVKLDVYAEDPRGDRPVQGVAEVELPAQP